MQVFCGSGFGESGVGTDEDERISGGDGLAYDECRGELECVEGSQRVAIEKRSGTREHG